MASPPELLFQFASKLFSAGQSKSLVAAGGLLSAPLGFMSGAVTQMVCLVLNHLLDQQRSSKFKLQKEAGKVLALRIAPMQLGLRVNDQGYFQPSAASNGVAAPADTQISMQWADLIGSVSNPNAMSRKAAIEGDMDFAQTVSTVINDLSWDPERDLARVVGDAQAVWVMNTLSAFGTNARDVVQRFKNNLREYVVHEKSMAPTASEFDAFRGEVNQLRDEVARLEKRLAKLGGQS
ncbi:MAG: SCP2 sterol-binding domain-containing protein [Gammaproteobacteria bacterium]|uniref:ubiquinone biosynthesis accessory factor UbiJ n=1 Tax=Limnobacter sp. TaxID=2003368 RepID=UPI001D667E2C|nr:SCP2 sterol-binding domain-containing protein [Limnobacter sp.]MBU0784478.1 SCP2 sterol-binding domain-containing protein [Gammaproteobacteria bacterium]MBU0847863.1 SCP2 sterol-binding domain-containing protein [Gammaproteobacteria bacterium]MBU1268158.1 SCP2 sterol-binding domain-containing protein [Gammaproteobacteria bacterium]MBU1527931.1 SCP2 sterol-binding domain-containing protein [Gammaproteobacteria bacterium]MBU1780100.1 SCP2 sterol-binding domain-containing protein [Gammaproteob